MGLRTGKFSAHGKKNYLVRMLIAVLVGINIVFAHIRSIETRHIRAKRAYLENDDESQPVKIRHTKTLHRISIPPSNEMLFQKQPKSFYSTLPGHQQ